MQIDQSLHLSGVEVESLEDWKIAVLPKGTIL